MCILCDHGTLEMLTAPLESLTAGRIAEAKRRGVGSGGGGGSGGGNRVAVVVRRRTGPHDPGDQWLGLHPLRLPAVLPAGDFTLAVAGMRSGGTATIAQ